MKPTRWVPLAILAAVGLAAGWIAVDMVERFAGRILVVPSLAAVGLWILAVGILIWAIVSRGSLTDGPARRPGPGAPAASTAAPSDPNRRRMPPLVAARTAALALAASRTGAVIGGLYLGIALALTSVLGTTTGAASFAAAIAGLLACAVLVGSAVWLESMCRIREDDD